MNTYLCGIRAALSPRPPEARLSLAQPEALRPTFSGCSRRQQFTQIITLIKVAECRDNRLSQISAD
jgi:hypothetical protein